MNNLKPYSAIVLRIGIALVFIWFGINQLSNAELWTPYIPSYAMNLSHLSAVTLVYLNGTFELIFGAALLFGIFTRIVAFFLMLHMLDILITVGFDSIGVRDFGLLIATISIFLNGSHGFSLDQFMGHPDTR